MLKKLDSIGFVTALLLAFILQVLIVVTFVSNANSAEIQMRNETDFTIVMSIISYNHGIKYDGQLWPFPIQYAMATIAPEESFDLCDNYPTGWWHVEWYKLPDNTFEESGETTKQFIRIPNGTGKVTISVRTMLKLVIELLPGC